MRAQMSIVSHVYTINTRLLMTVVPSLNGYFPSTRSKPCWTLWKRSDKVWPKHPDLGNTVLVNECKLVTFLPHSLPKEVRIYFSTNNIKSAGHISYWFDDKASRAWGMSFYWFLLQKYTLLPLSSFCCTWVHLFLTLECCGNVHHLSH